MLGAFKLDHLQPVEVRFFRNFPTFLLFILGSPIPYYHYPRERKVKYEKREIIKNGRDTWDSVPGVFKLDYLQSVDMNFFQKNVHPIISPPIINHSPKQPTATGDLRRH